MKPRNPGVLTVGTVPLIHMYQAMIAAQGAEQFLDSIAEL